MATTSSVHLRPAGLGIDLTGCRAMRVCLLLGVMAFALTSAAPASAPVVHTTCGPIQGVTLKAYDVDVQSFLGVPYASPPVNDLRWKAPQAAPCWSGTFPATKPGAQCVQFHGNDGSEDCLFLNVYSTHINTEKKAPVFFWIHGGDNTMGSLTQFGALEQLVALTKGDVVVVGVQYRLAAFGYLALKELTGENPKKASGNYGIQDLQAALRWTQANVAAFGGDPDRVTLIGQSSGGTNIFALMASPASRGLFQRAISLSGSPNITMSLDAAETQGLELVANTKCVPGPDLLACLRSLNASQINTATPDNWDNGGTNVGQTSLHMPGMTIVDGVTVVAPLEEAYAQPIVDVPFVIQSMLAELDFEANITVDKYSEAEMKTFFLSTFGTHTGGAINDLYAPVLASEHPPLAYYQFGADFGVACGNIELARIAGKAFKSPVYLSVVTQFPDPPIRVFPASYGVDVCQFPFHVFDYMAGWGTWDIGSSFGEPRIKPSSSDLAFGDLVRRTWVELAFNGTMPAELWPSVSAASGFPDNFWSFPMRAGGRAMLNYNKETCKSLAALGFNKSYWWIN
eukprot:m.233821 g.233821  ORF g.233821 m.233821 type:complete len:570 (-) comp18907_c4_seq6:155-1864(-)